jgi:hypothetical protein
MLKALKEKDQGLHINSLFKLCVMSIGSTSEELLQWNLRMFKGIFTIFRLESNFLEDNFCVQTCMFIFYPLPSVLYFITVP